MSRLTIMPVYNASAFIKEAVDSILQQTFRDFELWTVDDASTDSNDTNQERVRTVNNLSSP